MTTHHDRSTQLPERPTPSREKAATRDDSPRVAGPVPITVWRLDDHDDAQPATEPGARFAARLARRLVLTYTSHGETVADLDDDPHLHSAATAAGRAYLAIIEPAELPGPDQLSNPVSLITLRWPRHPDPSTADQVGALLMACRPIMAVDGCLIAAVRPSNSAEPGGSFAEHEHALRTAAEQAGLTHVLQIVAISGPGEGDQFLYYATHNEATRAALQAATAPDRQALHIDLLAFRHEGSR